MLISKAYLRRIIYESLQELTTIVPNQAEISRADFTKELGKITVVKRPQPDGKYLVAIVTVPDGKIVFDTLYDYADDRIDAGIKAKSLLRQLDKYTGVVSPMSYRSRDRNARKYTAER